MPAEMAMARAAEAVEEAVSSSPDAKLAETLEVVAMASALKT